MSERWFISDTHFSHRAIIKYSPERSHFSSLEEHDEELVKRWNEVVRPDDKVYHIGDFCLNRSGLSFGKRLNGRKFLVMGNHDSFRTQEYLDVGFYQVGGALQLENLILTHIPVHPQQFNRFFANVHGHLHSHVVKTTIPVETGLGVLEEEIDDWRYLNVGCEHTDLRPITLEEVYSRIMIAKGQAEAHA